MTPLTIAVLITCHNRREKTLECLRRLDRQTLPEGVRLCIHLVDDGSTDGTGDAVAEAFPDVRVIEGSGSLYWAGGMRVAWTSAAKTQPDYFLLLNDDTEIRPNAICSLLNLTGPPQSRVIAVAAITAPSTNTIIYGAYKRRVNGNLPENSAKDWCDTFNANCALIPKQVWMEIGMLNPRYTHGMADHDYGFLASGKKINIIQSSEPLGTCSPNSPDGTWQDPSIPRMRRLAMMQNPNALPWREWLYYCIRNHSLKGLIFFVKPFIKVLLFPGLKKKQKIN